MCLQIVCWVGFGFGCLVVFLGWVCAMSCGVFGALVVFCGLL